MIKKKAGELGFDKSLDHLQPGNRVFTGLGVETVTRVRHDTMHGPRPENTALECNGHLVERHLVEEILD